MKKFLTARVAGGLVLAAASWGAIAQAVPTLSFYTSAQTYGYINTSYTSAILGNASFQLQMPTDYKWFQPPWNNTPGEVASMNFHIQPGLGGQDPIYDIVTSNGAYSFHAVGQAQVDGLKLRGQMAVSTLDAQGNAADAPNSQAYAYAWATWNQGFYIAPTAHRPAGSYGAILVGITLHGDFPTVAKSASTYDNENAYAYLNINSSFVDSNGVSFQSNFGASASSWDQTWTGSVTVYKKLLFQYGTVFNLQAYQQAYAYDNASADFFNTGSISYLELPFGATLESGASQQGLGTTQALFGNVVNSATADDPNTNWDFGNNGGGFTPPPAVPEPASLLMLLGGLGVVGLRWRRMQG
jgi:ABC-type cobalt transport system substrate-binding protein